MKFIKCFPRVFLAIFLLFGPLGYAFGDVQLIGFNAPWKYNQSENLDGLNWWSSNYEDATWSSGDGLLYYETNAAVSPRTTPLTLGRTTYYFRTSFSIPFAVTNLTAIFSCRIDDGAVFYLNGHEIQRLRMSAPPSNISYADLATGTPAGGDATILDTFVLSGTSLTNLKEGNNLVAVEVHQSSLDSDDVVFGLSLTARFTNSPPVIVAHPTNIVVAENQTATFTAIVDGHSSPLRQWFKNGEPIPNATSSSLSFSASRLTNAGVYFLRASNLLGVAYTSNAVLTVNPDTNPPVAVAAVANRNLTNVLISFSESLSSSSVTGLTNYQITPRSNPTQPLPIHSAVLQNGTNVLLVSAARIPGVNYALNVSGVRDASAGSNVIAAGTVVPLMYATDLIGFDSNSVWRFNQSGQLPATNWFSAAYNDSAWPVGSPLFAAGFTSPLVEPVRTALVTSNAGSAVNTHYFRARFVPPGPALPGSIRLRTVVDDGAVFYLNDVEAFSLGMPSTRPLFSSNYASRIVGTPAYEPGLSSPGFVPTVTNLLIGENVISAEVHQAATGPVDVAFAARLEAVVSRFNPRPTLVLPPTAREGSGTLSGQGQVLLQEAFETNVVVPLSSTSPGLVLPPTVTINAGATNVTFDIGLSDDLLVNGPRAIACFAGPVDGYTATATVSVLDDETNQLSWEISLPLTEGQSNVTARLHLARQATQDLSVSLGSSDSSAVILPSSVTIPSGETSIAFNLTTVDDRLIDGAQSVTVNALVPGWPMATTNMIVTDNESLALALSLPPVLIEGGGGITSTGRVTLAGIAVSNIVIGLQAAPVSRVIVPPSITIEAGQSNVSFAISAGENNDPDGTVAVTILATAVGFPAATNTVVISDNDPHYFEFSNIDSPQDASVSFGLNILARDASGALVTNFNRSVSLLATGLNGELQVEPPSVGSFVRGQWSGTIRITSPGRLVRVRAQEAAGLSNPFHVEPQAIRVIDQRTADIAWHAPSGALLANVPADGGVYSNKLIVIDPVSGQITNSYLLSQQPDRTQPSDRIEVASNGAFLYASINERQALRRFDLTTKQAGLQFPLSPTPGQLTLSDFTVLADSPDSVVAITYTTSGASYAGVWRYNAGSALNLSSFSALAPTSIESSPPPFTTLLYGFQHNNAFPLMRGSANPGSSIVVANNMIPGSSITYRGGVIYDDTGRAVLANPFNILGNYPGVLDNMGTLATVEIDSVRKRAVFLTGRFTHKLKVYDRDSFLALSQIPLPLLSSQPGRLVSCGTNGMAFNTSQQILLVRGSAIEPLDQPANLVLTQSATPLPAIVGESVKVTMVISNSGPGLATLLRISNSIPKNATVQDITPTRGVVNQISGGINWILDQLDAGSHATLLVTLKPSNGGWMTNTASVTSFEPDTNYSNNISQLNLYVELPAESLGVFPLPIGTEGLLYDAGRDRLLLSMTNGPGTQSNGIAIFDPRRGTIEQFRPLDKSPSKLVQSAGGEYLYVCLKQDAKIRRLRLSDLSHDLDISLGNEIIQGAPRPLNAGDFEVLPDQPGSIAVWRVRSEVDPIVRDIGRGIAIFDGNVMRSNTLPFNGGSFVLEFDRDQNVLYAYQGGFNAFSDPVRILRRLELSTTGVSLAEQFPNLHFSVGNDIEYASGRFLNTSGRSLSTQPLRVNGIYSGSETASLVEADPEVGRVFFLSGNANPRTLNAYDIETFEPIGSLSISNVIGTPSELIRWGTNGLAFRTSDNQLFIIRTPLANPGESPDLAVTIDGPTSPVAVGNEALLVVTASNNGVAPATAFQVTNVFSPAIEVVWAVATEGSIITNANGVRWEIPSLATGADEQLALVVRPRQAGVFTLAADLSGVDGDPRRLNNSARRVFVAESSSPPDTVRRLSLPLNDLVWSSSRGQLLGTVSNSQPNWAGVLVSIDPVTLEITPERSFGGKAEQMTISDDGSQLFIALNSAVATTSLPELFPANRFPLDVLGQPSQVLDFEVLRDAPDSILIGRSRDNGSDLVRFNGGLIRPTAFQFPYGDFTLEHDGLLPHVYLHHFGAEGFYRYRIEADGPSLIDVSTTLLPPWTPMDLRWADGNLVTTRGNVINPATRTSVGTIPGVAADAQVCHDAASQRVIFVSPSGTNALIRVVDSSTLITVGTQTVTGMVGAPTKLVRWGQDGLACSTSGGQLIIMRTGLLPNGPEADLALALTSSSPGTAVGSNFVYSISVTNLGPNPATNAQVLVQLSPNTGSIVVSSSQGTASLDDRRIIANLGSLPAHAVAHLTISLTPTQPGALQILSKATAASPDPNWVNNYRANTNAVGQPVSRNSIVTMSQPVTDLVYHAPSGRLQVSGGSQITLVNPSLAINEAYWNLGGSAGPLALSDDQEALYAVVDGQRLARLDAMNGSLEFIFAPNGTAGTSPIANLTPIPGNSASYVLSAGSEIQVYDNTNRRPNTAGLSPPFFLEPSSSSNLVFITAGIRVRYMTINDSGIEETDWKDFVQKTFEDCQFDSGLLYAPHGAVVRPTTKSLAGEFSGLGTGTVVRPDRANHRILFLTRVANTWQLRAYDPFSSGLIGTLPIGNIQGTPTKLVRWGQDGLAFGTTSNQLFILRTPLLPAEPAADLALAQVVTPAPVLAGSNVTFLVYVTNSGPNSVTNVVLFDRLPSNADFVAVQVSQGAYLMQSGLITCNFGDLANGAVASLQLTVRPRSAGLTVNEASVVSPHSDPFPENNVSAAAAQVTFLADSDQQKTISLRNEDIVYHPQSGLIYASLAGYSGDYADSIISIDPATGVLGRPWLVGPLPTQVVPSEDGQYLYTLIAESREFTRLRWPSGAMDLHATVGLGFQNHVARAGQIKPVPSQPNSLAAIIITDSFIGGVPFAAIFDGAVRRPQTVTGVRDIEFVSDSLLLGYEPQNSLIGTTQLQLDQSGLTVTARRGGPIDGSMRADNGLIYTTAGNVIDPVAIESVGSFPASGLVAPDQTANRTTFLVQTGSAWALRLFDQQTRITVGSINLTNVQGVPNKLIRCGGDRVAFRTSNQVFIVRTTLLPSADLVLTPASMPPRLLAGQPTDFQWTIRNDGPWNASGVLLTNRLPIGTAFVSATQSQGSFFLADRLVVSALGELASNASTTVTLTVLPTNIANVTLTNAATVNSQIPDAFTTNNSSVVLAFVLADNDRDRLADDWEALYGLRSDDPTDATVDLDHDGHDNRQEYVANTNPHETASVLRLVKLEINANLVQLSFLSASDRTYIIERSSDVRAGTWTSASAQVSGNGTIVTVTIASEPSPVGHFYRIRLLP